MLTVDAGKMRRIDTRNVESLFGMWSGEHDTRAVLAALLSVY